MAKEPLDPVIEKYRKELLEFSRQNPKFSDAVPAAQPEEPEETVVQTVTEDIENIEETLPETRIVPAQGLVHDDLTQQPQANRYAQRLSNVSAREAMPEPPSQQPQQPRDLPQAQREDCNEQEHAYGLDADKYPPFCNGEVDQFESEEEFLRQNPEIGYLRVQVFAANQSYPVQNARVQISKIFGGKQHVFFTAQTDASGIMPRISLPAPDRELASAPSALQPYATYEIAVSHPGFTPILFRNCAVFDRIETIQYAELIPLLGEDMPDTAAAMEE